MSDTQATLLTQDDLEAIFQRSPFIRFMNLEIREIDHAASRFSARLPLRAEYERRPDTQQFHGGAVAALIDVVGDFALGITVGGGVPTMNLRVDYLRPATGAYIDCTAVVRRTGRTSAVVDIEVFTPDGKLAALGRGTYVPVTG